MIIKEEINNVYAKNVNGNTIHISEAESGRKGYFCLGCEKEMQAVKSNKPNRISYFRHDHNATAGQQKCTYNDETYRHKLAKEYLLRYKRVKVPPLYKYPPTNSFGIPNLLAEAKFIEAASVGAELYFYENENGEIIWNKAIFSDESKYLLFKPDIIFFDNASKPILLIEIVVTHKIPEDKLLSLKRMGIDTIQITIPKDSPENIEKTFVNTNRTKWIYNYEQENTEYIPISSSNSEAISSIDELQRKLFEESYNCRRAQINNLIRSITRCLGSEQYRGVTRMLESEISRVERNTEEHRKSFNQQRDESEQHLENIRIGIRNRVNSKYRERREAIISASKSIEIEEAEFLQHYERWYKKNESDINYLRTGIGRKISEKYRNRRESTEKKRRDLEERYNRKRIELEAVRESNERTLRELFQQISSIGRDIEQAEEGINGITAEKQRLVEKITDFDRLEATARDRLQREQESGKYPENKFTELGIELEERFKREGIELEARFNDLYRQIQEAVKTRTFEGNEYTRGYKDLLSDLGNIDNYISAQENHRRIEKAWQCFTSAAYQHWHD